MKPTQLIGLSAQLQNGKDTVADLIVKLTTENRYHSNYSAREGKFVKDKIPYYSESLWKTRRFAGKLKQMAAILLGCDVKDFEDINFKNKPLGEEWRRWFIIDENTIDGGFDGRVTPFFANAEEVKNYVKEKEWDWLDDVEPTSEILTPRLILQILGTEGGRDVIHPNIWVNATLGDLRETDHVIVTDVRFPNEVEGIKRKGGKVIKIIRPSVVSTSTHASETSLNNYTDWDYVIVNDGTLEDLEKKVKEMLIQFGILNPSETVEPSYDEVAPHKN